ncbi:MAG: VWA domain-containing protein [Acidobacteria bacterium]|nr:MAG: VWA domain-containing protein [Acidobacteriota bacterium]
MRAFCLLSAFVLGLALAHGQQKQAPIFAERVDVERVVVDVRVLDNAGNPVTGLGADDFSVRIGRTPVAIESAMWVGGAAPGDEAAPAGDAGSAAGESVPDGRLVIFLIQKDFEPSRFVGLMRMLIESRNFIDELTPRDRVAVLSFDTQLKIWLDFTREREPLRRVLRRGILFESPQPVADTYKKKGSDPFFSDVSLMRRLDPAKAAKTYTIERALLAIAEALHDVPGAKSIVLLGHGFGRLGWTGVAMEHGYEEARDALLAARTSVFSLDVTNADYHSLEAGLQLIARDTGGFFARTHLFVEQAMKRLAGAIAGHYVLFLEQPDVAPGTHDIRVRLTRGQGTVFAKHAYVKPTSVR